MNKHVSLVGFFIVMLLSQSLALAQVYRWVDENGKVHFTDQPPPGQEVETVNVRTTEAKITGEELAERRREQLEELKSEREAREQARAEAAAEKRERAQKCEAAKKRYDNIVWQKKIHEVDEQGNKTYLSDEEEERVKQEAADAVSEFCN